MKTLAFVLILASSISSAFAVQCTSEDLAIAKEIVDKTQARFDGGTAPQFAVKQAQSLYLDVAYCAGEVMNKKYCRDKEALLNDLRKLAAERAAAGAAPFSEEHQAVRELIALRGECSDGSIQ